MNYEKSCGFVVYKKIDNINYYLLIKSLNGDVGFPKGHMELGETEIETAIRELKEETNVEVNVINGFRYQIEYKLPNKIDTIKQSIYFLGEYISGDIIKQDIEVSEARFVSYSEALDLLTFNDTKKILIEADMFIK